MNTSVDWRAVDLVIFDVDGTLYDQSRLRLRMALEMAGSALAGGGARDLRIVRSYRRHRFSHRIGEPGRIDRRVVSEAEAHGGLRDLGSDTQRE